MTAAMAAAAAAAATEEEEEVIGVPVKKNSKSGGKPASNGQVLGDMRAGGSGGNGSGGLAAADDGFSVCPSDWKGMSLNQRKRWRRARARFQPKGDQNASSDL
jgi:hypothetical protein